MKRRVEFTPIDLRGVADIYSIKIEGEQASEFLKFLVLFRTETDKYLLDDFNRIASSPFRWRFGRETRPNTAH